MQVFLQAEALHSITVNESTTVGDLKEAISVAESVPCEEQVVLYGGVPLDETVPVCGTVPPEATLTVTVRVPGGKAHGSLARAGKVRGQTPKVDKQEKKKAKTGRAKRRMQYNRRFVNTVVTFGRKKGPNSNS
jgi:small subunit ribosomal protein S30e